MPINLPMPLVSVRSLLIISSKAYNKAYVKLYYLDSEMLFNKTTSLAMKLSVLVWWQNF